MGRFDWDTDIVSLYCFVNRAFEGENSGLLGRGLDDGFFPRY